MDIKVLEKRLENKLKGIDLSKAKLINEDGSLAYDYIGYLNKLNICEVYTDMNNHGNKYLAVRGFRDNGNGYSTGLSVYATMYYQYVPERADVKSEWVEILNSLGVINNKLCLVGHHGQTREINHE
jgi:hypothetical protein